MTPQLRTARRIIVVSNLHLGGKPPFMMSHPDRLAGFIARLPAELEADETLELVIAGDAIDFPVIPPFAAWTPDPGVAVEKLDSILRSSFAP